MPAADHRLTTLEMARFVAEGHLRFDGLVPEDLNERAIDEMRALLPHKIAQVVGKQADDGGVGRPASLTPLSQCYPAPSVLGELLRLPQVAGIIRSFVGDDPLYDHDFVHYLPARAEYTQALHVDAIVDDADPSFDVQLFYFPRAVEPGAGGTRFVPGSHLRRTRAEGVCRYHHLVGEQQYAGPAGTLMVFHQGLWHAGQANPSENERWMYKIRLNPTQPQCRLWNTDDFDAVHNGPDDHTFATMRTDSVGQVLRHMQPWQEGHEARYELVQRARLWRYLSGDERYDVDYYLTRMEVRAGFSAERAD
jgi:hypothetical protein